jgi:hypothetical protein
MPLRFFDFADHSTRLWRVRFQPVLAQIAFRRPSGYGLTADLHLDFPEDQLITANWTVQYLDNRPRRERRQDVIPHQRFGT